MRTIARFVARDNEGKTDLILGIILNKNNSVKSNTIYEIQECLGELTIKEIGPSAIGSKPKISSLPVSWCSSIDQILTDKSGWALTKDEWEAYCRKNR